MEKRSSIVFGHQKTIRKEDSMLWEKNYDSICCLEVLKFRNKPYFSTWPQPQV